MKISHSLSRFILGFLLVISLKQIADSCTVIEYETKCKGCVNNFVDGLREDPRTNCSMKYISLRKCILTEMEKCLKNPGMTNTTAMFIRQRSIVYKANEAFFCVYGMLDTLKNYRRSALPMCNKKFFKKATKCGLRFKRTFNKNRGGTSLCRRYYKSKRCMISALSRNCKASRFISQLISNYKQPYNPYCRNRRDPGIRQRSSGFGSCTQKSYIIKSRQCIKDFIHTLQRNGGAKCRATVDSKLIPCSKRITKRCLRETRDAKTLENDVQRALDAQRTQIKNKFCEGGFLETLPLAKSQCSEEYFETFQGKCNTKFITKYRENKANPLLCHEYAKVKRCARDMTTSLCKLDDSMIDAVHFVYGDFNPFCHDGKDPPIAQGMHDKQTTSAESNAGTACTWSLVTLIVATFYSLLIS